MRTWIAASHVLKLCDICRLHFWLFWHLKIFRIRDSRQKFLLSRAFWNWPRLGILSFDLFYLVFNLLVTLDEVLKLSHSEGSRPLHFVFLDQALQIFALLFCLKFFLLKLNQRQVLLLLYQHPKNRLLRKVHQILIFLNRDCIRSDGRPWLANCIWVALYISLRFGRHRRQHAP